MAVKELTGENIAKLRFNEAVANYKAGTMAVDTDLDEKFGLSGQYYAKYKVTKDEKVAFVCSTIASSTGLHVIKGTGFAAGEDVTLVDSASTTKIAALESAKFVNDDGYIYFYCNNAGSIGVIETA